MIDLRSDTVTAPTPGMRSAMAAAPVGDDVYGEDPTVTALEERVADLFGHEAALFCVSGSLANLLAVRSVAPVGTDVLCDSRAHIVSAELGAHAALAGTTTRTWTHPRGLPDRATIESLIAPDGGPYFVRTAAIAVENTHNFAGGAVHSLEALRDVRSLADEHGVAVHVDGARIWNAHVATNVELAEYGAVADVMAVCLSKGLGAPVGSLTLGSRERMDEARVWRKRLGAGWRQAGLIAAAGMYALDHHLERLTDDHAHARMLAEACGVDPQTVDSNIVVVPCGDAPSVVESAKAEGVRVGGLGPKAIRLVTHLDVTRDDTERAAKVLGRVLS